jgi:histidinol-phosphate aminotransferase
VSNFDRDSDRPFRIADAEAALGRTAELGAEFSPPLVIPSIANLRAYPLAPPWRDLAAELGIAPSALRLLSANENVLGPSPRAVEAGRAALLEAHLYPDGGGLHLKSALAERLGVRRERVVLGNGSNDIIELLVRTFVGPGETVVTGWPSFVVYRLVPQAHGRDVILAPLRRDRYDLTALAGLIDHRTKVVFVANPNNPTGTHVSHREVVAFLERIPRSVIVVLDEAYLEYVTAEDFPRGLELLESHPRLVLLRTFSKAYGLAGLRIGYGVMDAELADYVERVRQPYNVSSVAQAAALAALDDTEHLERSRALARAGLQQLTEGFARLRLEVVPSQANFVVVRLPFDGAPLQAALRDRGILVRAMGGYGMPDSVRVTIGTEEMNAQVLREVEALIASGIGRGEKL